MHVHRSAQICTDLHSPRHSLQMAAGQRTASCIASMRAHSSHAPLCPPSHPTFVAQRFFSGSLAHLFVWNRSVTPEEMRLVGPSFLLHTNVTGGVMLACSQACSVSICAETWAHQEAVPGSADALGTSHCLRPLLILLAVCLNCSNPE